MGELQEEVVEASAQFNSSWKKLKLCLKCAFPRRSSSDLPAVYRRAAYDSVRTSAGELPRVQGPSRTCRGARLGR